MKVFFKKLTIYFAVIWLMILCLYSSLMVGTLMHELMHQHYSVAPVAIQINYDGSGHATSLEGAVFTHSHEFVYLIGDIVMMCMIIISFFSCIILIWY